MQPFRSICGVDKGQDASKEARGGYFGDHRATCTTVEVTPLPTDDPLVVEFPAVAVGVPAADRLAEAQSPEPGTIWQVTAERVTQSWTSAPHLCLPREASRLVACRERFRQSSKP